MTHDQRKEAQEVYLDEASEADRERIAECFDALNKVRSSFEHIYEYCIHHHIVDMEQQAERHADRVLSEEEMDALLIYCDGGNA